MFTMQVTIALAVAAAALSSSTANGAPMPTGAWPSSTGSVLSAKPIVVAAGTVFDGKMQTYERSDIKCKGGKESSSETAVFLVEPGATLKNVIIGKNQMEGVHCDKSDCTIENVWWDDVCEDALSIKGGSISSVSRVIGGGARYADDKIIQHDGAGSVSIDGFFADDFGKLYRSCGTCGAIQRSVSVSNVYAVNPQVSLVTVNSNFGDVATLRNITIKSSKTDVVVCSKTIGTNGEEPTKSGNDVDGKVCVFSTGDVSVNGVAVPGVVGTTREAVGAEASSEVGSEAAAPATVGPSTVLAPVQAPAPWPASVDQLAAALTLEELLSRAAQPQAAPRSSFGFAPGTEPQLSSDAAASDASRAARSEESRSNSFGFGSV